MNADPVLPESVRSRIVVLAADVLGTLEANLIPGTLRPVARFTPKRRARAVTPIAAALERDEAFRGIVASTVRRQQAPLAQALDAGEPPSAADPVDVAAVAWLLRTPGWQDRVAEVASAQAAAVADNAVAADTVAKLQQQLDAARATARSDQARLRDDFAAAKAELDRLRRELRQERDRANRAEAATRSAAAAGEAEAKQTQTTARAAERETRRLRAQLAEAQSALEAARRSGRESRSEADNRLRLLLDAVVGAAQGLARELALPPVTTRPADTVPGGSAPSGRGAAGLALATDDPALLDTLVRLPAAHLLVDGYNVTKSGYGDLPLEQQRDRLLAGLAALAARTRAEVTCVFDGAEQSAPLALAGPRGVRLLFSDPGVTADELIRRLVRAEPEGRPLVVVSSDREVAEGVQRSGATALPSVALLRLLDGR